MSRARAEFALLFAVLFACACEDVPNPPAVASDGRIAVCVDGAGRYASWLSDGAGTAIVLVSASGTEAHRITKADSQKAQVAFSPDGTRLAYVEDRTALVVIDADGSNRKVLVRRPKPIWLPRFSPAGDRLAYVTASSILHAGDLEVASMAGGAPARLAEKVVPGLTWLEDGRRIACVESGGPARDKESGFLKGRLLVVDTQYANKRTLDEGLFLPVSLFATSPKSHEFFWICPVERGGDEFSLALASCHPDTGNVRLTDLDASLGAVFYPALSPDGRQIVAIQNPEPEDALAGRILTYDVTNGHTETATLGDDVSFPTWTGADRLVYVRGEKALYVAGLADGNALDLTPLLASTAGSEQ